MTVGEKIRAARKAAGLTQKELAEKMKISYQNLAQWETGKRNPKLENIAKIADALDMSVDDILGNTYYSRTRSRYNPDIFAGTGKLSDYVSDQLQQRLLDHFHQLNPQGQELAVEQVELVAKVPEYRADQDHEDKEKRPHT